MNSHRPVIIYISAASDLMIEREALARMIAKLPVTLAWQILQTPLDSEMLDLTALQTADLHILVMGTDIRAPVGLEWQIATYAGRQSRAFLKREVSRTPAGQNFIREIRAFWQPFNNATDLSYQAQRMLIEHLLGHKGDYALTPLEVEQLEALQTAERFKDETIEGQDAGHSAVILSRERFEPSDGISFEDLIEK